MRLTTDEEFSKIEKKVLIEVLKHIGEFDAIENQKKFQRSSNKIFVRYCKFGNARKILMFKTSVEEPNVYILLR